MLQTALSQYGILEIPGDKSNPEINKYFDIIGETWADDDVAWCGAFMNWCAKRSGLEHSGELTARSWLKVGLPTKEPKPGDVVVLWRESPTSWKGHVGMYVNRIEDTIYILGGNQNNMVKISGYPASRLLSYRKLRPL